MEGKESPVLPPPSPLASFPSHSFGGGVAWERGYLPPGRKYAVVLVDNKQYLVTCNSVGSTEAPPSERLELFVVNLRRL